MSDGRAADQPWSLVPEAAREGGLLIGTGGSHLGSVPRIAPPLSLTIAEAAEGADALEDALRPHRPGSKGVPDA